MIYRYISHFFYAKICIKEIRNNQKIVYLKSKEESKMNEVLRIGNLEVYGIRRIFPVLKEIQSEFSVEKKGESYQYRNVEDVVREVRQLAHKHDMIFTSSSEILNSGTIKVTVCLIDAEGNYVSSEAASFMDSTLSSRSQNCGSAISYAKKYAIYNLLAVADREDDIDEEKDTKAVKSTAKKQATKVKTEKVEEKVETKVETNSETEVGNEEAKEQKETGLYPEPSTETQPEIKNCGTSIKPDDAGAKVVTATPKPAETDIANEEEAAKVVCNFHNQFEGLTFKEILGFALGFTPKGESSSAVDKQTALDFFNWLVNTYAGNEKYKVAAQLMLDENNKQAIG